VTISSADQTRQRLIEHLDELAQLTPALQDALQRDHTPETGNKIAIGGVTLSIPINTDVLRALDEIPIGYLHNCLADYEHALSIGNTAAARQIGRNAEHWRRLTKRALGLLQYDRTLNQPCPQHDEPLTELLALGDEGWLHHDNHGYYVQWQKDQRIWCRHCGSLWQPNQMLLLGRLLKWAAKRRAENNAEQEIAA
jgi:hypothetical protein